jgi:hypothetical protein
MSVQRLKFMKLNPKQIAEWFRSQAKQFNKIADQVEATFKVQPRGDINEIEVPDELAEAAPLSSNGTVTAAQFEAAVRNGRGRLNQFAERLSTTEDVLRGLLEPASKVYIASAGWVRIRE